MTYDTNNSYHFAKVTLEQLNARCKGRLPELMGIEFLSINEGRLTSRLTVKPEFLAPNGFLHAATIIALADTTAGFGSITHLPKDGNNFTTIELKSNFLGTATNGVIECECKAAHLGRTTQVWDATVKHQDTGKSLALFRCTQMILYPKG